MTRTASVFAVLLMTTAPALAQPADPRLSRLSDGSLETREQGERDLAEDASSSVDDLLSLLASGELDPETHRRIARAAYTLFATTPRAGMGVEFDTQRQVERGVPIIKPVENFPAFEIIEPGDVILTANGIELTSNGQFGQIIVSHDPGDVLEVTVLRGEDELARELALQVPLGSFSALGQRTRMDRARLVNAFELRCSWAGVQDRAIEGAVGDGLSLDDWASASLGLDDGIDPDARPRPTSRGVSEDPPVLGGRPRTHTPTSTRQPNRAITLSPASGPAARNLDLLARRMGELARQRVRLRNRLERGDETEAGQQKLRQTIEDLDARIDEMLRDLGALEDAGG